MQGALYMFLNLGLIGRDPKDSKVELTARGWAVVVVAVAGAIYIAHRKGVL